MKVLSLFDGMACGMLAMQKAGVEVYRYVAYEIDKYAVQTSTHNFPMIEHRGDVFQADFSEFSDFDFLVGGSPCTYWSIAQNKNRETEASGLGWELFSQYVRALHEAKPKFFIYENNKSMSKAIRASIDEAFGFEAVCINSAQVSAQNRQRLYWVGKRNDDGTYSKVNVEQPEDRGILLKDVLDGMTDRGKGRSVIGSAGRTTTREYFLKQQGTMAFEPCCSTVLNVNPSGKGMNGAVGRVDAKSRCLTTNKGEGPKVIVPVAINTTAEGDKARTLMAGYYKCGTATLPTNPGFTGGTTAVADPVCMRYERSEEAKAVRKQYEAGEIKHGFHELHELHPRADGKTNTLSTVLKDNPICEPVCVAERGRYNEDGVVEQRFEAREDGKTNVLTTVQKDNNVAEQLIWAMAIEWGEGGKPIKAISSADGKTYDVYEVKDGQITVKGKQYPIKLADGYYIIRKLTVRECMRLQTVPEWYEFPVSDSQAYKMLGNGWTVDVIVHLITSALGDK